MDFEKAVEIVLRQEGGYIFDSNDPGGETNFGISKRQFPDLNIKDLTRDEATAIYKKEYWDGVKALLLPPRLRLCVFDCAVNQGVTRAIRILQGSIGVKQDGIIGPETFEAARLYGDREALSNMLQLRLNHYVSLPQWPRYGAGWMRRLLLVTIESLG